ncbi:AAA family ATPase [Pseudomonas entomophila]|uniref:AAA family ATPase n=1 Tax=Pseudomonas entomophila TaxID=312306 RepID=UPI0015E41711|nr:AAA family ATPase [Pseudomonas entomophila]MBA1195260.1 AAA family ATPase [Pseudomonas entomophila]
MSITLLGHTKGGEGKTTVAVQLAFSLAEQGKDVLLVNGDRQRSANRAVERHTDAGTQPPVTFAHYPEGKDLSTQVLRLREKFDEVVIDAGGRDSSALRAAMLIADVMIIPVTPATFGSDAIEDELLPLIHDVQTLRGDNPLPIYSFLNKAQPLRRHPVTKELVDPADNVATDAYLQSIEEVQHLGARLVERNAIGDAAALGVSTKCYRPRDVQAIAELDALMSVVF